MKTVQGYFCLAAWLLFFSPLGRLRAESRELAPLPQGVEMEALAAFRSGIALYEQGHYLEATEKFEDAYTHNDKFSEAILWEARCYDAAELKELGDAMRHYERTALVGQGFSRDGRTVPSQGAASQPTEWEGEIVAARERLAATSQENGGSAPGRHQMAELPPVSEIEAQLKKAGTAGNIPLLQLVLADPQNAMLRGRVLHKPGNSETGISGFLNHALRDHLIAVLPAGSDTRAWLEVIQIQRFTDQFPFGRAVSPRNIEPQKAFADFAAAHPDDLPGAVAQFFLLRETCGVTEPAKLAAQLDALGVRISRCERRHEEFPDIARIEKMTSFLDTLAHIAAGEIAEPRIPSEGFPYFARLSLGADGRPKLDRQSYWFPEEWNHFDFTPAQCQIEARACLALAGRTSEHFKVEDRWLTEFPHSILLASYCSSAIHEAGSPYGEPFLHPFDATAEKAAYRAIVEYAKETLIYWMRQSVRAEQMDQIEGAVRRVVMFTCEPEFAETISDAEQLAIRDELIREMAEADARLGRKEWSILSPIFSRWRGFSRAFARSCNAFRLGDTSIVYYDGIKALKDLEETAEEAFSRQPEDFQKWWTALRGVRISDTFGPIVIAELAMRHAEDVRRIYPGPDFSERQLGQLLDFGIVLMEGGEFAEAEHAFRKIVDGNPSDLDSSGGSAALRASAAYYLALLQRRSSREAEAAQSARLALDFAHEKAFALIDHYSPGQRFGDTFYWLENTTSVRALAPRMLTELSENSAPPQLPERVGLIPTPTPNLDNPRLRVYYRLPPSAATAKEPLPVLVLMPPFNQSPLESLQTTSAWAKFADDTGIVLFAPDFFTHRWVSSASPAITGYGYPQSWSGDALIAALAQLAKIAPIRQDGLLFHGFGEGANFCARFARWKPELCRAVSAHSTGLPWYEEINGLQPLGKLRDVPFLVTCGEEDGRGTQMWNRYSVIQQFVTMARGAGVPLLWRSWSGVYHVPTPQMEDLSRAFLRDCLKSEKAREEFVGDRRSLRFFPAGSVEAATIPELFRERLPSRETALLWGENGK